MSWDAPLQQRTDQHCRHPYSMPAQEEDSEKMICLGFYSASGKEIRMFFAGYQHWAIFPFAIQPS